jgi:hypothetical protein
VCSTVCEDRTKTRPAGRGPRKVRANLREEQPLRSLAKLSTKYTGKEHCSHTQYRRRGRSRRTAHAGRGPRKGGANPLLRVQKAWHPKVRANPYSLASGLMRQAQHTLSHTLPPLHIPFSLLNALTPGRRVRRQPRVDDQDVPRLNPFFPPCQRTLTSRAASP